MSKGLVQLIFYNDPDGYPPIVNAVRLLARSNYDVEVLCRNTVNRWNVAYPNGVRVVRIGEVGHSSWHEYFAFVLRVLRQGSKHASVIYAHDMHALIPGRILATMYNCPIIYHSHDFAETSTPMPAGSRIVYLFQQRFARTADHVVIPDADRAKVIADKLRLTRPPLIVANAPLNKPLKESSTLRQTLAARGYEFAKIVFRQGRIGVGHAIETTLRSIPFWASKEWGFVIMGFGEPDYIELLNRLAQSLGIENQFSILSPVGYDQVAAFTIGADIGHALYEQIHINNVHITTASNKIMEYMSTGLPILVSDTVGLCEHVRRYRCGLTADEKSPESIAEAVNKLLGDEGNAKQMGIAGRTAFEQEFCYERQFKQVIDEIEKLVQAG